MPLWGQMNLQESSAPILHALSLFHDAAILMLVMIMSFVGAVMGLTWMNSYINKTFYTHHSMEAIWTALPGVVLACVGFPSLYLLFTMEDAAQAYIAVKAVGNQWYWTYHWNELTKTGDACASESYMIPEAAGKKDLFRLLDTTAPLKLPVQVGVRVYVTSADVLHSWTVPSLGVKADACPGRLNELMLCGDRPGVYFGQCSEICGANHSFMPIQVHLCHWG